VKSSRSLGAKLRGLQGNILTNGDALALGKQRIFQVPNLEEIGLKFVVGAYLNKPSGLNWSRVRIFIAHFVT
jgi:hypothetical protein